jgi:small-conductance mechanosensitive channel
MKWLLTVAGLCLLGSAGFAQAPGWTAPAERLAALLADPAISSAAPADQAAALVYQNRPIVMLRARVLSRMPSERAAAAARLLDDLVAKGTTKPVAMRELSGVAVLSVHELDVFAILPSDVDLLSGETVHDVAARAASRLDLALAEAVELRAPIRMVENTARALGATAVFILLLWALRRVHGGLDRRLTAAAHRKVDRLRGREVVHAVRLLEPLHRAVTLGMIAVAALIGFEWMSFVLRSFPYTRPWGESLKDSLIAKTVWVAQGLVGAFPDLFTILVIVIVTRFLLKVSTLLFDAVEAGRIAIPGIYPETAQPTRHLVAVGLWLFALATSYPYLPGSNSDAFKGVSVFVGLMISLGSSGLVNQAMGGLTVRYSRALRLGDFVRIGDVEGTVVHIGALSTKLKTPRREEVTIPHAVVVSQMTTNFSRHAEGEGVLTPTSVTIGYDAPWRQVHAMLLQAAARTPGIRPMPPPIVLQSALDDFSVQYTLCVCLEHPHLRVVTLGTLHANIQDAFNEHGVQIMTPHYESDPQARKVVPKAEWYPAPAAALAEETHSSWAVR